MFKRILLALTFVAALGAAGLGTSGTAMAHGCGYGGYGYRTAYYPPVYASYYSYGYSPQVAYYPSYYPTVSYVNFGGGHRRHNGLTFTFGF